MATITDDANSCVQRGIARFWEANLTGSLEAFAEAIAKDPRIEPYLWQRGICQYYSGQFQEGKRQFEVHKTVNPHDVENALWHFLCVARADGIDVARQKMIQIDTERDSRVQMAELYALFSGDVAPERVLAAVDTAKTPLSAMYAHLYLGLYYEVAGDAANAKKHMRQAAAEKLDDVYMHDVANVHMQLRNWKP